MHAIYKFSQLDKNIWYLFIPSCKYINTCDVSWYLKSKVYYFTCFFVLPNTHARCIHITNTHCKLENFHSNFPTHKQPLCAFEHTHVWRKKNLWKNPPHEKKNSTEKSIWVYVCDFSRISCYYASSIFAFFSSCRVFSLFIQKKGAKQKHTTELKLHACKWETEIENDDDVIHLYGLGYASPDNCLSLFLSLYFKLNSF